VIAPPPQVALTAVPARVQFARAGSQLVQVRNSGRTRVIVDVTRAGFALDLRGSPRVVAAAPSPWLRVRPRRAAISPGAAVAVTVSARIPRGASPGDHTALLLLATRPLPRAGLAVRMRLGVVVALRVPGRIVHRVAVEALRVRRSGRVRTLSLRLENRGNVTEELSGKRLTVTLWRRGRLLARLRPAARELLPRSRGVVEVRYRGSLRGAITARVTAATDHRSFRVRL
jgi:hypothetical protein